MEDRDIVERLREPVVADAFEKRSLLDGQLAERLIRERLEAADEIVRLRVQWEDRYLILDEQI